MYLPILLIGLLFSFTSSLDPEDCFDNDKCGGLRTDGVSTIKMIGVSQTSVVALDKDKEGSTSGYLGPSEEDYSLMLIH